jgi:hypothetical protein
MLYAYLRRAKDVTGGMERDPDAVERNRLPPVDGLDWCVLAHARTQDRRAFTRAQVTRGSPPRVIAMGVRNDRTLDGLPRVDVEITRRAVQPALGEAEERQPFTPTIAATINAAH